MPDVSPEKEDETMPRIKAYAEADVKLTASAAYGTGEVRMTDPETGAQKGSKEARFDLIPVRPLTELAELYGFGAKKYAARNWERGYDLSLSYAALQRHANLWWGGEDTDSETLKSHMASVAWHAFTLMQLLETHPEKDDRPSRDLGKVEGDLEGEPYLRDLNTTTQGGLPVNLIDVPSAYPEGWQKIGHLDDAGVVFIQPKLTLEDLNKSSVLGDRSSIRLKDGTSPQAVWAHDPASPMTMQEYLVWQAANPRMQATKQVPNARRTGKTAAQEEEVLRMSDSMFVKLENAEALQEYENLELQEIYETMATLSRQGLSRVINEAGRRLEFNDGPQMKEEEPPKETGVEEEPQPKQLTPSHMMEVGLLIPKMSTGQLLEVARAIEKQLEEDD